jgi:hypothetical protein
MKGAALLRKHSLLLGSKLLKESLLDGKKNWVFAFISFLEWTSKNLRHMSKYLLRITVLRLERSSSTQAMGFQLAFIEMSFIQPSLGSQDIQGAILKT